MSDREPGFQNIPIPLTPEQRVEAQLIRDAIVPPRQFRYPSDMDYSEVEARIREAFVPRGTFFGVLFGIVALALSGCCSTAAPIVLTTHYAPLTQVVEAPDRVISPDVTTTVYSTAYVGDMGQWISDHPEGSLERSATLEHERVHAVRQFAAGAWWFVRYVTEPGFRWAEEQLGWREEIRTLRAGRWIDQPATAAVLSGTTYELLGRPMVSYADALAWVRTTVEEP